jgi:hypothetical protein
MDKTDLGFDYCGLISRFIPPNQMVVAHWEIEIKFTFSDFLRNIKPFELFEVDHLRVILNIGDKHADLRSMSFKVSLEMEIPFGVAEPDWPVFTTLKCDWPRLLEHTSALRLR